MEDIRKANETLREWGNSLQRELNDLQDESDNKDNTIYDLQQEIHQLSKQLEDDIHN